MPQGVVVALCGFALHSLTSPGRYTKQSTLTLPSPTQSAPQTRLIVAQPAVTQKQPFSGVALVTTFVPAAVVVTIGPSCQDVDTLSQLLQAGATCARCDLTVREYASGHLPCYLYYTMKGCNALLSDRVMSQSTPPLHPAP